MCEWRSLIAALPTHVDDSDVVPRRMAPSAVIGGALQLRAVAMIKRSAGGQGGAAGQAHAVDGNGCVDGHGHLQVDYARRTPTRARPEPPPAGSPPAAGMPSQPSRPVPPTSGGRTSCASRPPWPPGP